VDVVCQSCSFTFIRYKKEKEYLWPPFSFVQSLSKNATSVEVFGDAVLNMFVFELIFYLNLFFQDCVSCVCFLFQRYSPCQCKSQNGDLRCTGAKEEEHAPEGVSSSD
jgi:hypothetical protein